MKYLVIGPSIINDIKFADGTVKKGIIGGSIFCVAGIKLWCDDCLYISNVGKDYSNFYGNWMKTNKCSYDGINEILPHTQYTLLTYGEEGLHDEVSIYGSEEEQLVNELDRHKASLISEFCDSTTKGIYIEANESDELWDSLDLINAKGNIKIMWELPTSVSLNSKRHEKAFDIIKRTGLYSVNLPEAKCLFNAASEEKAIEKIIDFNIPCYFRVGKKGSYMICDGKAYFANSVNLGKIADSTGCGNCSTAAALYGFCEGYTPEKIAMMGNIAAGYNILQYGPFPDVIAARENAIKLLDT